MKFIYFLFKHLEKRLPNIDPLIKLLPIIKLIGNSIVSFIKKFIFPLLELFWIPIIKSKNKQELKVILKNIFLGETIIYF